MDEGSGGLKEFHHGGNVNLKRSLETEGWLSAREAMYLATRASWCDRIVEVGSWMGRSTLALGLNTRGTVTAVDTWKGSSEHQDMLRDKPDEWLMKQFIKNVNGVENIHPWHGTSLECAARAKRTGNTYDLIFLDGAHDYESVKADILAWGPLLTKNGILCGHDYDPLGKEWTGVKQAVEECVPEFCVVLGTNIWTTEHEQHSLYRHRSFADSI